MEAGPDKDHNELGSKNMGPSHDLLHIGVDSPQNTWTQGYRMRKHDRVSEWILRGT